MAKAYKCDICGNLYTDNKYPKFIIQSCNYYSTGDQLYRFDLCSECQKKLNEFVERGKEYND